MAVVRVPRSIDQASREGVITRGLKLAQRKKKSRPKAGSIYKSPFPINPARLRSFGGR